MSNGYEGRIVSFEPLSTAHAVLLRESEPHPNWAIAERCALGSQEGTVSMHVAENSVASSALSPTDGHLKHSPHAVEVSSEVVRLARLDNVAQQFVDGSRAPFLKIDVQGFEEQVLLGSTKIAPKLVGLQVELSFVQLYGGQKLFPEMFRFITDMGFTLHRMIPAWIEPSTGRWLQADGLFFRG
jgi:FkbM family methyltransferase